MKTVGFYEGVWKTQNPKGFFNMFLGGMGPTPTKGPIP